MGKVHPQALVSPDPCYLSSKQESFTVWMKSLVLSRKGCTVFDSDGRVVYRVDNYDSKSSNEVHLMDSQGKVLYTILRKKFKLLGFWEGYRCGGSEIDRTKPGFQVRKTLRFLGGDSPCKITVGSDKNQPCQYRIESWTSKSAYKIVDNRGALIAEVKRKQSASGVVLGEDVMTLMVEPFIDHSLIMGLVVVYSLISSKM
ncbi:hypothetical protein OIU76_004497 [Salix suchowensis]|uniref:Uncharacterized protein n=1 Tax=Salix suchowensis TaxID=1278906 RepID=A0ABQ9BSP6_9ROSI|nr:protein LURP-one-related [Salix suchowensis]KAJ6327356.1 hypothetical protein OIU78_014271 [Salix suchowensis]KAJ6348013.1 hypothetical protein OIU76_004497 [Salix suchowensis]KAJ6389295.1 hypothetical protein OIU77_027604 [Salix suchowensis]